MKKRIEFYKIHYNFVPILNTGLDNEEKLKKDFVEMVTAYVKKEPKYIKESHSSAKGSSILIETLASSEDYIFGIIAKLEDLTNGILKRFRDKKEIEIVESIDEDINYYIEHYTYFYIRLEDLNCAVMSNRSAPKFRMHFTNYLKEITETLPLESLNIVNVYDDRVQEKINRTVELSELKMVFDDTSVVGNELIDLRDSFHISQSNLKEAKIDLTFKMQRLSEESKKLLTNNEVLKSDFSRLEVIGIDDDDKEINVELIERILTKKISIQIDEEHLRNNDNLHKIKEALRDSF